MSVHVRFAPSPTGRLHIGNIRPAVLNWLFARKLGGRFLLRLDDTDRERSSEAFAEAIRADLAWLGLGWDALLRQSERTALYAAAAERLKAAGRLYPCYETPEELERRRKRQLAQGRPPVYDRAALRLTAAERSGLEARGLRPHWRFLLANHGGDPLAPRPTPVAWDDLVRGPQSLDLAAFSDPVLVREDGAVLYTFASVVDDAELGISHVIRGEDHVANTAVQIDLFRALGHEPPRLAHHSLLVDADGHGLSKRLGSLAIADFRAAGLEPMAVASYAATIGTSGPVAVKASLDELATGFDLARLSRAPARFSEAELEDLNAGLLHMLPVEAVAGRLAGLGVSAPAAFWAAVRANLRRFDRDVAVWQAVTDGTIAPVIEDAGLCAAAAALLPEEPWDATTWGAWTARVGAATGRKGRALFHPLRLALTGREQGPELKLLLPLIGRARAAQRLAG